MHIFQVEPTQKYILLHSALPSVMTKAKEKCKKLSICWPRPLSLSLLPPTNRISLCKNVRRIKIRFSCNFNAEDARRRSRDPISGCTLRVLQLPKGACSACLRACVCLWKYMCLLASNLMYAHLRDLRIIRLPLDWAAQAAYAQFDAPCLPASLPACLSVASCALRVSLIGLHAHTSCLRVCV